ncbi:hypothetical protein [Dehalobacter sp.]|nr:hypothetical protein [Dehalobacter sp.]MDJ0306800.1 hypothetical protein [Dehalobacter sp.]
MSGESKLKITVIANKPSNQALRQFQKKLYQLQKNNELNILIRPVHNCKA